MITLKIDCTKIEKARLFPGKDGAMYLDCILIATPDNKWNDYMVVQSVTKEERLAGVRGAILGNAKHLGDTGGQPQQRSRAPQQRPAGGRGRPTDEQLENRDSAPPKEDLPF